MAVVAEDLGVTEIEPPVGTDMNRDDVIDDLRRRQSLVGYAPLAQKGVEFTTCLGQLHPCGVVTPFGRCTTPLIAPARGCPAMGVTEPLSAHQFGTARMTAAGLQSLGHVGVLRLSVLG
jgi:hypothetical protein